ncbi:hypothetical protein R6L23_10165 [Streptomyces sp. SR27]|uniref:hypothetical protein n=1 Tax=unclassified Streptomyces TaxID=2593676 RepID=UPI00295B4475|nr:hypothetical protein [Streptomyces sp. SR27]MDV9188577.1 hypothetical protein [Streptomyces sp. SR27]
MSDERTVSPTNIHITGGETTDVSTKNIHITDGEDGAAIAEKIGIHVTGEGEAPAATADATKAPEGNIHITTEPAN